jgi:hypothetical protein
MVDPVPHEYTAAITHDVEQVLPKLEPITFPIWLTTHRELHTNRRIRIVFDFLAWLLRDDRENRSDPLPRLSSRRGIAKIFR